MDSNSFSKGLDELVKHYQDVIVPLENKIKDNEEKIKNIINNLFIKYNMDMRVSKVETLLGKSQIFLEKVDKTNSLGEHMEINRVQELVNEFLDKTDNICGNCGKSYIPYDVVEKSIVFKCSNCGLELTITDDK